MTQAGTIDLGGSARTKQSGSPWPAVALTLAIVVATIAAVWFTSSAGRVGTAKPAADRSYDQIEAQRGMITLAGDRGYDGIEAQRGVIAPTYASSNDLIEHLRIVTAQALAESKAAAQGDTPYARDVNHPPYTSAGDRVGPR